MTIPAPIAAHMDEVLACTSCGHVKWTAREIHPDLATTGGNNGN